MGYCSFHQDSICGVSGWREVGGRQGERGGRVREGARICRERGF